MDNVCSICLDELNPQSINEYILVQTPCSHQFHLYCIVRHIWHSKSKNTYCPLCRHLFSPAYEFELMTRNPHLFRKYRNFLKSLDYEEEYDQSYAQSNSLFMILFILLCIIYILFNMNILNHKNTVVVFISVEFLFLFLFALFVFCVIVMQILKCLYTRRINNILIVE